jgi:drug/metabolite transporter (DMT)-like permease
MVQMTAPATLRVDNIRLGILYMVASVFLFSIQNAIGKWLAQSYPIPMLVFFRSFIALLPSFILVMRAGGPRVMRTNRMGAQFGRAVIWGGSNAASFVGYHLLPLADAVALTFAAPLFLTALSYPIIKERVSRERWIAVSVGFVGVLVMARPSGAENALGVAGAVGCAVCNAVGTLTVRDLCRTEHSASIVTWTAIYMTLMALPALPFFWVTPTPFDFLLFCLLGLIGGVSQYWTTTALSYAPAAAVSPFNRHDPTARPAAGRQGRRLLHRAGRHGALHADGRSRRRGDQDRGAGGGDNSRGSTVLPGMPSTYFETNNRGVKSVTLNLKAESGGPRHPAQAGRRGGHVRAELPARRGREERLRLRGTAQGQPEARLCLDLGLRPKGAARRSARHRLDGPGAGRHRPGVFDARVSRCAPASSRSPTRPARSWRSAARWRR